MGIIYIGVPNELSATAETNITSLSQKPSPIPMKTCAVEYTIVRIENIKGAGKEETRLWQQMKRM